MFTPAYIKWIQEHERWSKKIDDGLKACEEQNKFMMTKPISVILGFNKEEK